MASQPMLPASTDIATVWAFLEEGVDHIMTKRDTDLPYERFWALYTVQYNYCTSSSPSTRGNLNGYDLYNSLVRYFEQYLQHLRDHSDSLQNELLLSYYSAKWDMYTTGANYVNSLFAYLNRHWIKRERDEGRRDIYPIYTLALIQWRESFFLPIQAKLTSAILHLIERRRNGETVNQGLFKKVVESFISLRIDESDLNKTSLDNYREHFETPFLAATEAFYKHASWGSHAGTSVSGYLKKTEERLKEEEDRAELYLHPSTRRPLITIVVRTHANLMAEDFQSFLVYDKDENLQRMYSLLSRSPEGLEPLQRKFEEHAKRTGLEDVYTLVGPDPTAIEGLEPKVYVDALLEVHAKLSETINRSFKGDAGFVASLDRACRGFVNQNAATGTSPSKSPELLAKHADALLRKSNKMSEEGDLEGALNRVMIIFNYLEEKDVFQTFYSTKLSKRLIHGVSISDKAEASMISKLKMACGFEYTNKLQRMFTDMSLSKDLTDSFRERMEQGSDSMDINFSVMILGTNFWPLNPPKSGFVVPTDIHLTYDRFQRYYQTKHTGRKLTWLWNYSKNELQTNYLNQKYILMTSAYQMAVLLQYNDNDSLSLDELATATNVGKDLLTQVLQPLVKSRILINDETESQYNLNLDFKSKKIRMNLNQPIKAEVKAESSNVLKRVDEDRKYVIQATIVRIMKTRKTMEHQPLIQEVISSMSQRCKLEASDIKKEIDKLLDKDYIGRVHGTRNLYTYVVEW